MKIVEAQLSDLDCFFEYLGVQLLDNAADETPLFQPIAKEHCIVSEGLKPSLETDFNTVLVRLAGASCGWLKT
ncbi:hypothetical protein [Oceanospirillum beijerinckii]|uniref:hypothetical protein n=1 Tax=Oceanospirillum beijerinckii TaxID=64976 RepID=UPI001B7FA3CC|nr:hypothetical protein [Oceanospirillum beijerinckii]